MDNDDERDLSMIPGWNLLLEKEKVSRTEELTDQSKIELLFSLVLTQQIIIDRANVNMVIVKAALNLALKGLDARKLTSEEADAFRTLLTHRAFNDEEADEEGRDFNDDAAPVEESFNDEEF
ncbi:MAG TPA: hypothetical protein VNJ08_08785 [Bacteriovoracaceae bacterium]|nr:hypothetical protein [Bacteriovoracaceae bacterium]